MSKALLETLVALELTCFGAHIPAQVVRDALRIVFPATGTKAQFDKLALAELSGIDYVRNHLLNEGKYLRAATEGYRILLPSENIGQVETYMSNADQKLRRAMKLLRNTPKEHAPTNSNHIASRIAIKRDSARHIPGTGRKKPPPEQPVV